VSRHALPWLLGALLAAAAALFVAAHHPIAPAAASAGAVAWVLVAWRWPRAWLFVVPAALPVLGFAPWTGWIGIDEFDLLLLATLAAGHARLAWHADERAPPLDRAARVAVAALLATTLIGLARGLADAGGARLDWFQGYTEPLNSLRVAKSLLFALALLPLVRAAAEAGREAAFRRLAAGVLVGAALVVLAVLWERLAYTGLFDMTQPYRTTALFWEMHVGGAAIDAYIVLATPFVVWALWAAPNRWLWAAAAGFALLWAYAGLTTFARGAYLGAAVGLLVLGLLLPVTRAPRWWLAARGVACVVGAALLLALVLDEWGHGAAVLALAALAGALWLAWRGRDNRRHRSLAIGLLVLALVFEAVLVVGPETFMSQRAKHSARDYQSRTAHWARGLALLDTPADALFGLGLGRLPAHYDRDAPGGEFPGSVQWVPRGDDGHVRIAGPRTRAVLGGRHGLTQRVPPLAAYRLRFDLRHRGTVELAATVCESHLLYVRACQGAWTRVAAGDGVAWRTIELPLRGPPLSPGAWFAPRQAVLAISVIDAGGVAELDRIALSSRDGTTLLENGDFARGMAHWWPSARTYYVPWHIDNLVLELLIERGLVGLLAILAIGAAVMRRIGRADGADEPAAAFIAAALCGVLALGLLSSVFDAPRVALLALLLVAVGSTLRGR